MTTVSNDIKIGEEFTYEDMTFICVNEKDPDYDFIGLNSTHVVVKSNRSDRELRDITHFVKNAYQYKICYNYVAYDGRISNASIDCQMYDNCIRFFNAYIYDEDKQTEYLGIVGNLYNEFNDIKGRHPPLICK